MEPPTLIALADIDADALPRDRAALDADALDTLQRSILAEGLRQPIEVFPIVPEAEGAPEWGLISGLRRLTVFRALAEYLDRFAEIPAYIRTPADIPAAVAAMVSENENRAQVSPWEKARLVTEATDRGLFPTHDAALAALFPLFSRTARARLRAVVTVVEAFEGLLRDPQVYSHRQLLRLATAVKAGFSELVETALTQSTETTQAGQWELLQHILIEAEKSLAEPGFEPPPPYRAKRLSHPLTGLTIRREWLPNGWRLVFTGSEAKGMMIDGVLKEIERMYGPPPG